MAGDGRSRMELDPRLENLATARRFVRERLDDAPPGVVADIEIIASELLTNAVEHGPPGPLSIAVVRHDSTVSLTVDSPRPDPHLPAPETWAMADVNEITGRGLAIVRRLADDVSVDQTATSLSITATRSF